jgi:peptide-methionine (S)-S-oxide reductase
MKQFVNVSFILFFIQISCQAQKNKVAYFGSGCFWCVEAIFETVKGVKEAESGYCGGTTKNPTYEQICTGRTGHAETVKVTYDPNVISYADLVRVFFNSHDPTTLNQQGPDKGTQYRSVIFYANESEKELAKNYIKNLLDKKTFKEITTTLEPFSTFYPAEAYHQDFEKRNPDYPYVKQVSLPRLKAFKNKTKDLLKKNHE